MVRNILMILAACAFILSASPAAAQEAAENGSGPAPDTFLFSVPLSGPLAAMGKSALNGAELALKTWGGGYKLASVDETAPDDDNVDLTKVAVVIGYFTESRFAADAPRYLYLKKPVLLPFLTTGEAASRGPDCFFRLMPSFEDQGSFMAMEILNMKKRPRRILIITGEGEYQAAFTSVLTATLAEPPQPEPPATAQQTGKSKKTPAPQPVKPLDPKSSVLTATVNQAMDPEGIPELTKAAPDLIILALSISESLTLAPTLTEPRFAKVPVWGGMSMGFREAAAAFSTLGVNLNLCLPVANPLDVKNKEARDFIQKYLETYKSHPTWISALAYDSIMLAIKSAGNGSTSADILSFMAGQTHHSLGTYKLAPGGGGQPPLAFMPVTQESLGFLP